MSEKKPQPFEELNAKHWGSEQYYKDPLMQFVFTEGVKDFIETYNAGWLINRLMLEKKVRQAKDQVYPSLVVDSEHMTHMFFDCDHATLGKDKPLFSIKDECACLPEGKLNFEFSPWEQILILMSEH